MKLKSLTLNGFKSFADKTKIDFYPGITGIVGPNGSGKSNIIEALRWVLGEQSAKSLRGDKMLDVIFAGSETRAPLNRAEVELVLDNSDHFLDHQPDEVAIKRLIYRSGESEYLINNRQVRLRDIVGLFMDTGLGKESFSIISQGKVEAIFNSKPEERRIYIEEAAGVLKYKKEKQHAEKELVDTSAHLDRVADIVTELRQEREPLQEQASIARDYQNQKQQFDYYEKSRLILNIRQTSSQQRQLTAKNDGLQKVLASQKEKAETQEAKLNNLKHSQEELEQSIDTIQSRLRKLSAGKERLHAQDEMQKQQRHFREQRKKEIAGQLAENKDSLTEINQRLKELTGQLSDYELKKKKVTTELASLSSGDNSAVLNKRIAGLRDKQLEILQAKTRLETEAKHLRAEKDQFSATSDKSQQAAADAEAKLKELKDQSQKQHMAAQAADKKLQGLENDKKQLKDHETKIQLRLQNQRQRWQRGQQVLQQAISRSEALAGIAKNYNGYYQGVKAVLNQRTKLKGIIGAVAEILDVPEEYNKAIEVALGSQLQNVVVTDDQAAREAIKYLRTNQLGRATFLPRTTVKPYRLDWTRLKKAERIPGFVGQALSIVNYSQEDERIASHLLGGVLIAKDLKAATEISRQIGYSCRIVTLKGDQISASGSFTGGRYRNQRAGILEQKAELQKLEKQISEMKQKLAAISSQGEESKAELNAVSQQSAELDSKIEIAKNESLQETSTCRLMADKLKLAQDNFDQVSANADNGAQEKKQRDALLADNRRQLADLDQELAANQKAIKEQDELLQSAILSQNDKQTRRQDLNEQLARLQERQNSCRIQQQEALNQQARLEKLIQKGQQTLTNLKAAENGLTPEELSEKKAKMEKNYEALADQLEAEKKKRHKLREDIDQSDELFRRLTGLQEDSRLEIHELTGQINQNDKLLNDWLEKLRVDFQTSFEQAEKDNKENDLDAVNQHLKLLKKGIAELGNVNLGAIDEFKRVDERYQFLLKQQDDLLEAKDQLNKTMNTMDEEVKSRFKETFDQVAAAFKTIFPQIFGGGRAELLLTDESNLLETGIEIKAQPPGKNLRQMSLLSGGERALTAITLLFAILKVKPVPFAILDEAEAALDDANIERYSNYLRKYDDNTQFIIITHRKGTMMQANVLYGVTMQESGVSQVVSVSLDDAV